MIISGKATHTETGTAAIESQIQREWNSSPALQAEFLGYENYAAFRKAELQGKAGIYGGSNRVSHP